MVDEAGGYEYEYYGARQRVRLDGRILGYVLRRRPHRWLAFSPTRAFVGEAERRRDATAFLQERKHV